MNTQKQILLCFVLLTVSVNCSCKSLGPRDLHDWVDRDTDNKTNLSFDDSTGHGDVVTTDKIRATDSSYERTVQYTADIDQGHSQPQDGGLIRNRINSHAASAGITKSTKPPTAAQTDSNSIVDGPEDDLILDPLGKAKGSYPVDFSTVLRLAGADNWNVKIAQQRVLEAQANVKSARAAWLPNLTYGLGYNNHAGEIQATEGQVVNQSRNSLFVGGGLGVANSPLNGGSGGPPRMFVDFSLADAVYQTLSSRRKQDAAIAQQCRVFNDTLLKASLAYFDLVQAQAQIAIANQNLDDAKTVLELTQSFVEGGKGTEADTNRMQVIVNQRQRDVIEAQANMQIASTDLATVLQLDSSKVDPELGLFVSDANAVPIELVDVAMPLNSLIGQAQQMRCEIAEAQAQAESADAEMRAEQLRPWLPNLYVGASGGAFGGGTESNLPKLDGRSDVDIVMNWQIKNLGFGTSAAKAAAQSRLCQSHYETQQAKDLVSQQVASTYYKVQQYRDSLGLLQDSIDQSKSALDRNIAAIRGLNGLPLEAFQSLNSLASSRAEYLATITAYNQWQMRLLRATGQPLASAAMVGVSTGCNCSGCNVSQQCNSRCRCECGLMRRSSPSRAREGRTRSRK